MRRNLQVRNHVGDSVEHGIDKLHSVAGRFLVYPLAAAEGAIQGAARGVHNVTAGKPHGSACGSQHVGVGPSPYEFYSCTTAAAAPLPPPAPAAPPSQFQYHYHAAFPVPCRPPY
ncbi:hypothetical protein HRI_003880200 [Hibiscus trionum]|uniref:Uncharacterized protein n=1 Tax=Hibiscus trionum TaxID=183268 RepID=A0A9W7MJK5_HIBTR|nr:hypothetical protein HRI_003880200 [Hibiscus trionum]